MKQDRPRQEAQWTLEAPAHGWLFLGRDEDPRRCWYRHVGDAESQGCDSAQRAYPHNMRAGRVACKHCEEAAWKRDAAAQGWRFLAKTFKNSALYEHLEHRDGTPCNSQRDFSPSAMRDGKVACDACRKRDWQEDAAAQGWEFLAKKGKKGALYRHLEDSEGFACGEKKVLQPGAMRNGAVACNSCRTRKWQEDAFALGWEFLKKNGKKGALYRHLEYAEGVPCGKTKVLQPAAISAGKVACEACVMRAWNEEALSQGWELLHRDGKGAALYRHLHRPDHSVCGLEKRATLRNMRIGAVRCKNCYQPGPGLRGARVPGAHLERWRRGALEQGWEFVQQVDGERGLYRHVQTTDGSTCGAERVILAQSMNRGAVKCLDCLLNRWRCEALENGWELIEKVDGTLGRYRHLKKADGSLCNQERIADASAMRKGIVPCPACTDVVARWQGEARAQGWELLEKLDGENGSYRHLTKDDGTPCGHERTADASMMRVGHVACPVCTDVVARWREEALPQGWELLEKLDGNWGRYRHLQKGNGDLCGATKNLLANSVKTGSVRCDGCQSPRLRWEQEALRLGWRLVDPVDGNRGLYEHLNKPDDSPCGHKQVMIAQSLRIGAARCQGCSSIELKWQGEAEKHGWELIKKLDGDVGLYQHLWRTDTDAPCNHRMEAQAASMRLGTVRCPNCTRAQLSTLHQQTKRFLEGLAQSGMEFEEEVLIGLKPALEEGGNDGPARADFLVLSDPGLVIEIDGEQHFRYTPGWHVKREGFRRQVFRDVFVEEEARDLGLIVLRFGTWEGIDQVKAWVGDALAGRNGHHRLAEQMCLPRAEGDLWALREEGRKHYRERLARLSTDGKGSIG